MPNVNTDVTSFEVRGDNGTVEAPVVTATKQSAVWGGWTIEFPVAGEVVTIRGIAHGKQEVVANEIANHLVWVAEAEAELRGRIEALLNHVAEVKATATVGATPAMTTT